MIVVDTCIWIDFFRDHSANEGDRLVDLVCENNRTAICGVILQEILQGIRDPKSYELVRQRLLFLPYLDAPRAVYLLAATLYRDLRKAGVTVPSTDTVIAAVAIHHEYPLFTSDRHFLEIAQCSKLKLYS